MTKQEVKLALCGAGRWGKRYLETIKAEAAKNDSNFSLRALASVNPDAQQWVPYGCTIVASWRDIVSRRDVDGVIVATPPSTHFKIAQACAENGLACLIEKPLTTSLAEAENLKIIVERQSRPVMVGHTLLFHPAYLELKKRIGADRIIEIESTGCNWGPFRSDYTPLWDYAPHDIAFCLDLIGTSPNSVIATAAAVSTTDHGGHSGRYRVALEWDLPLKALIRVSNIEPRKERWLKVKTEKTSYLFDDLAEDKLYELKPNGKEFITYPDEKPLASALNHFISAIRNELRPSDPTLGLNLAVQGIEVLTRAEESLSRGPISPSNSHTPPI